MANQQLCKAMETTLGQCARKILQTKGPTFQTLDISHSFRFVADRWFLMLRFVECLEIEINGILLNIGRIGEN